MWRPYVLYVNIWGLLCLLATALSIRKWGPTVKLSGSGPWTGRLGSLVKYLLVTAGPNLLLIGSILLMPRLNSAAPGITADMAIGFSFIHSLIQHFYINFSLLYIALGLSEALLADQGENRRPLINLPTPLASHFLRTWRVFVVYLALSIFIQETFVEHFAVASFSLFFTISMTLPVPIYLSLRLIKLRRLLAGLSTAVDASVGGDDSAEAMANMDVESETVLEQAEKKIEYKADNFIHKNWFALALASLWLLSLISLINPAGAADLFTGRLIGSVLIMALAFVLIRVQRHFVLRWLSDQSEHGRQLAQNIDNLANAVIWLLLLLGLLIIWGFPLGSFLENDLTRDILGRAVAIGLTVIALVLFIRLSRLATEWLLSVPTWGENRNWRTMTPLVLTAFRALAIFVGVVVILERLGVNVGPILAGAGILGLGVGMGAQSLVKDVINGISILLADTLAVGDFVTIGGKSGTVESVGLRNIRLRDAVGNLTVVPNSTIDVIVNQTRDYSQEMVDFIVPYDADPDAMLKLADEVGQNLSQDGLWRNKLTGPVSLIGITAFDASGTTIRMKVNTRAGDQWAVGRELRLRLKRRLRQEGIDSTGFGQNVFFHQKSNNDGSTSPAAESGPEADQQTADPPNNPNTGPNRS